MWYRTTVWLVNALGSDYDAIVHKYGLEDLTTVSNIYLPFNIIYAPCFNQGNSELYLQGNQYHHRSAIISSDESDTA